MLCPDGFVLHQFRNIGMSLIKGILIKRREFVILLILILLVYGCMLFLFLRSSARDEEQSRILGICETAEDEIRNCRINIDELNISGDTIYLSAALINFKQARHHILSIANEIDNMGKRFRQVTLLNLPGINQELDKLESIITPAIKINSISGYTDANKSFSTIMKGLAKYKSGLQENEVRYHSNFKIGLFILFAISFMAMLYLSYIIVRLIKTVLSTDRYVVGKTIEIEQHERLRIAMDLHDGLGAYLSSIIMYIKLMEKEAADNKCENEKLGHIRMLANNALQSTKEVINNLNPSTLNKYGLIGFLELLCDKINQAGKTEFELDTENFNIKLPKSIEVFVYRITNELINNTLKHSGATKAKITIWNLKRMVFIRYIDDGIGFNTAFYCSAGGEKMGLQNLVSRVESIGGKCKIESSPDHGVNILVKFSVI